MNFLLVAVNAKYIHSNPAVHSLQLYAERVYPGTVSILETTINQVGPLSLESTTGSSRTSASAVPT